jgi:hypothetical protein
VPNADGLGIDGLEGLGIEGRGAGAGLKDEITADGAGALRGADFFADVFALDFLADFLAATFLRLRAGAARFALRLFFAFDLPALDLRFFDFAMIVSQSVHSKVSQFQFHEAATRGSKFFNGSGSGPPVAQSISSTV